MLRKYLNKDLLEAGCDEAGRGCLAGPVFAAAVILPKGFHSSLLRDSKELSATQRYELRDMIQQSARCWAVASVDSREIDRINILNASFLAMHKAIAKLSVVPEVLLIDGNRFTPYENIPFTCIVKGDAKYQSIAAASILAKTYRDDFMKQLHKKFPHYGWERNKGYPTAEHREAIIKYGIVDEHRNSFRLYPLPEQMQLF
ncbi:MAG TPA: ribonuclease HII [Chitinophagales bacterium]|nr:ribonuclease HII [Chitinophagales bacterium]